MDVDRRAFAASLPFALDQFQTEALDAVEKGESVLVCAPTGSGKTVVAEFACWYAIHTGGKCFYTTPLKALSNQKFGDLIARHGAANVGLLTGDNSINGDAPIVVMTTEVLRNMLYEDSPTLTGLRWVVLDEVHYLQDQYRGAVWEEVIIHLPDHVSVVSLSATVSNHAEFGAWIETLRGPTRVILETERPVKLTNLVMVGDQIEPLFVSEREVNPALVRAWSQGTRHNSRFQQPGKRRPHESTFTPSRVEVAEELAKGHMLPAICFIFSRTGCDKAVEACLLAGIDLTTPPEAEYIREYAEMRAATLETDDLDALGWNTFVEALAMGVASHHAGMIPIFKETVEELFAIGKVKLVFATETLSLGINMPARSVVIERLTKFTGEKHELLTPMDYTQLTGRAGRRGIDDHGNAIVLYNPWVQLDRIATLATVRSYPLTSSFRPSYNMAVNLARSYDRETAVRLLNSSFAQFVADREVVKIERQAEHREQEIAQYREKAECDLGDIREYWALRTEALEAMQARRGSPDVLEAFASLGPGDVVWGDGLGKLLVVEQARQRSGPPQLMALTVDRKLRRLTPSDFSFAPRPVARIPLRGQGWRAPKARSQLARQLRETSVQRRDAPKKPKIGALTERYERHPVHACPDLAEHVRWVAKWERAEAEAEGIRKRIRKRRDTVGRTFEQILALLESQGYIEDWQLTAKGELLSRVYNESDLLVVEALERGWFTGLDPEELAAVVSMFVYESRGREEPAPAPNAHLARYQRRILNLYKSLHEAETEHGIELLREPDTGFTSTIYAWSRGATLEHTLAELELSAGDFVRSAKQVIDLLQQLRAVASPAVAETLRDAVTSIQRGVVAYSSVV